MNRTYYIRNLEKFLTYLNMYKYGIFMMLVILIHKEGISQSIKVFENCGTETLQQQLLTQYPELFPKIESIEASYRQHMRKQNAPVASLTTTNNDTVITLPVVIHIIHNNGPENISDAQVLQGLQELNDAFRNRGYYNPQTGVDTYIEFCLAERNLNGEETNGIIRHESSLTDMATHLKHNLIADLATWNTEDYLNIRLVRNACLSGSCRVAGYAIHSFLSDPVRAGIVMEADYFGSSPSNSTVLIHEMGHFLGLYHTFNKGCKNNNCLEDGDKVCDTPPDESTAAARCDFEINSCTTDEDDPSSNNPYRSPTLGGLGDQADHRSNYMDYSVYFCYDQFTEGQKDRMRFFITQHWQHLLRSKACMPPCENDPIADFAVDKDSIEAGESMTLSNLSSNATEYKWYLDGVLISQKEDTSIQFISEGVYTLRLDAWNGDIACEADVKEVIIIVLCPIEADFNYSIEGDWLVFTNTSQNEIQVEWNVKKGDGSLLYGSDQQKDSFNIVGEKYLQLCIKANNDYCQKEYCKYIKLINDGIEVCDNEIDDDGDGFVDLFDQDCECTENAYQAVCPIDCEYIPNSFPEFKMKLKWQSEPFGNNRFIIPNIVTGDINNDGKIEVITKQAFGGNIPTVSDFKQFVLILNGENGSRHNQFSISGDSTHYGTVGYFSIADLDKNKVSEIITQKDDSMVCYSLNGDLVYKNSRSGNINESGLFTNIADFNGDGIPELYSGSSIFNSLSGNLLVIGKEGIGCGVKVGTWCPRAHAIAADLLPSPGLELAAGNTVYKVGLNNINDTTSNNMTPIIADTPVLDGLTSVADIDGDRLLDVIVVKNKNDWGGGDENKGGIWIWNPRNQQLIARNDPDIPLPNDGGIAFIGNVAGNCRPEVGVAFEYELRMYKYDDTKKLNLLYSVPTSDGSGVTGITMFDFNQDGKNEVIYRDETYLRIIEGATGLTIDSFAINSGTGYEAPIIADIDNDGQAEILVSGYIDNEEEQRIFCFESAGAPWAPARSVWNQPGYHVTNVNDDLTIPRYPQNQAKPLEGADSCLRETCSTPYNAFMTQATYRTQSGCVQFPAVDLSLDILDYECTPDSLFFTIVVDNNSDTEFKEDSISISSYSAYPTDPSNLIEVRSHELKRDSGKVSLPDTIRIGYLNSAWDRLYFVINDIGTGASADNHHITGIVECDYENNLDDIELNIDSLSLDLGSDITKCKNEVITINAGSGFESYVWSDGTTDSIYSSAYDGLHFVKATDQCGRIYRDTVEFTIDPITEVDLGPDTVICNSSSFTLTASNGNPTDSIEYDQVSWFPRENVSCDSCRTVSISSDTAFTLYVLAQKDNCFSTDTLNIEFREVDTLYDASVICEGESLNYRDSMLSREGLYTFSLNECDSIVFLDLEVLKNDTSTIQRSICEGDSIYFGGSWKKSNGFYSTVMQNTQACDSIVNLELDVVNKIEQYDTVNVCEGDSVFLLDQWVKAEGSIEQTYVSSAGCDSTQHYQVFMDPLPTANLTYDVCQGDSVEVGNTRISGEGMHTVRVEKNNSCDSIYNLEITEIPPTLESDSAAICEGDSVFLNNRWVKTGGVYRDTITTAPCNTILNTTVEVLSTSRRESSIQLCPGDSLQIDGEWVFEDTEIQSTYTNQAGCDSIHTVTVTALQSPLGPVTKLDCENLEIIASINANSPWHILWANGDTTKQTTYRNSDSTKVTLHAEPNCEVEYIFTLPELPAVRDLPEIGDTTVDIQSALSFSLNLDNSEWDVQWSPSALFSCDTCFSTTLSPHTNTTVELSYTHESGCVYTSRFKVNVNDDVDIYIPNIFTPNGDNINDEFQPVAGSSVIQFQNMRIYNRWGELIHESRNNLRWDGTQNGVEAPDGVYVYVISYLVGNKKQFISGDVTLVR